MRNSNIRRIGRESALTLLLSCLSFSQFMSPKIKISEREKSDLSQMLQTDSSEFECTLTNTISMHHAIKDVHKYTVQRASPNTNESRINVPEKKV